MPPKAGRASLRIELESNEKWGRGEDQNYDECSCCSSTFNSCSIISKCVDNCILEGTDQATVHEYSGWLLGWPDYFFRWRQTEKPEYNEKLLDRDIVRELVSHEMMPPCMFNWFMIRSVATFQWTRWFDSQNENILSSLAQEQINTSLISALMATIASTSLFLGDEAVSGNAVYTMIWALSTALYILATMVSVFLLLIINEMSNDNEARQFQARMQWVSSIPIFNFILATLLAGAGCMAWFAFTFGVAVTSTFCVLFTCLVWLTGVLPLMYAVQTLWTVGETTKALKEKTKKLIMLPPAIAEKMSAYEAALGETHAGEPGYEYMTEEGFLEYLRIGYDPNEGKGTIHELTELSEQRARKMYNKRLGDLLEESLRSAGEDEVEFASMTDNPIHGAAASGRGSGFPEAHRNTAMHN
jgi:hypothetical protein